MKDAGAAGAKPAINGGTNVAPAEGSASAATAAAVDRSTAGANPAPAPPREQLWAVWLPDEREPLRNNVGWLWCTTELRRANVKALHTGGKVIDAMFAMQHIHDLMSGKVKAPG